MTPVELSINQAKGHKGKVPEGIDIGKLIEIIGEAILEIVKIIEEIIKKKEETQKTSQTRRSRRVMLNYR